MGRNQILRILLATQLGVFIVGVAVIIILHAFTQNFWDFLRIPPFLRGIDEPLGNSWPTSLTVYHAILIVSMTLSLINGVGVFLYKVKLWRYITDVASFVGLLIIWPVACFFIFTLATADNLSVQTIHTLIIYFFLTFFVFILDLATWFFDDESLLSNGVIKRKRKHLKMRRK